MNFEPFFLLREKTRPIGGKCSISFNTVDFFDEGLAGERKVVGVSYSTLLSGKASLVEV